MPTTLMLLAPPDLKTWPHCLDLDLNDQKTRCLSKWIITKTAHRIFFSFIFWFSIFFFDMKPLSEVALGLLIIQIQIQTVCDDISALYVMEPLFASLVCKTKIYFCNQNNYNLKILAKILPPLSARFFSGFLRRTVFYSPFVMQ